MDYLNDIAERSRRSLLAELRSGPQNVTNLVRATGMKQPNVSNHLAKLRAHGVVKTERIGRQVFYSLASPDVEASLAAVLRPSASEESAVDLEALAPDYARAACDGDELQCRTIVDRMIRLQFPLVDVYEGLLARALRQVGDWYQAGTIDEAQEHLASAITERMMARVVHYAGPVERGGRTAVLGCCAGNWHSIGVRMVSDLLRLRGWKTFYLGANVPTASFVASVAEHAPEAVLLSCTVAEDLEAALELVRALLALRETGFTFTIGVGGAMAVERRDDFVGAGADFCATDLSGFNVEIVPRLEADTV